MKWEEREVRAGEVRKGEVRKGKEDGEGANGRKREGKGGKK